MRKVGDILNKLEELLTECNNFQNRASQQQRRFYATHSINDFRRLYQPNHTNQQHSQLIDKAHYSRLTLTSALPTIVDALNQLIRQIQTNVEKDILLTSEMLKQKEEIFSEISRSKQETCQFSLKKAKINCAESWDSDFEGKEELSLSPLTLHTPSSTQKEALNSLINSSDSLNWSGNESEASLTISDEALNTEDVTLFRGDTPIFNLHQFVKSCWEVMCEAEYFLKYFEEGIAAVNQLNVCLPAPTNFTSNSTALLPPSPVTLIYNLHRASIAGNSITYLSSDCKEKSNKRYSV